MRIAFDLDGTLVPMFPGQFPVERLSWLRRTIARDPLRAGTPELLLGLIAQRHEVWVYTSSLRSGFSIRRTFFAHGVRLDGIVNAQGHARLANSERASKYPPAFGIDLLVDDAEGVEIEGLAHGFQVLRVTPCDLGWHARVRAAVDARA